MTDAHGPWLVARGLVRHYDSEHRHVEVLEGIDLDVHPGEVVAVTGASGSGKSTLLNLLGSLDPPDAGTIVWGDREVGALGDAELSRLRNRQLGFLFQSHHLLADFTALENVALPARVAGHGRRAATASARALLERVGLAERLDHRPGELSGGEQQRVAAARALVNRPRLLLADEPGGNLDAARSRQLHDLLLELAREGEVALVIVTHDLELASRADRWLELAGGRLSPREGEPLP